MTQPLQISVVGAGYWGKKVIREILNLAKTTGKVSLCSVVDNSPSTLEQYAKEFGPLTYHLNYRDLLSDPYVSAVHICSPNASHFEVASEFLRAKKDVLVEKPLALRTREAHELVRLAETTGRVLSTGHLHRFNNGIKELKRVVDKLDCLDQKLVLQRPDKTEPVSVIPSNTLGAEILHFADCVEQNRRSVTYTNLANGAIGAGVVRLLEASKKSLYEERNVQVQRPESIEMTADPPAH